MLWLRAGTHKAKSVAGALAVLCASGSLAGCGFTPVYGEHGHGSTAAGPRVANVRIASMGPGEIGMYMRESLLDNITGSVEPEHPTHVLFVSPQVAESSILVQSNAYVTRYNVAVSATYKLTDMATGQVVTEGQTRALSAYNVIQSEYATLVGKRDAERRAADTAAHDISMRVALYFSHNTGAAAATGAVQPPAPPTRDSALPSVLNPTGTALPGTSGNRNPNAPE